MGERLFSQEEETELLTELLLVIENPQEFAKRQDGKRPQIADYLQIPPGWVVDGRNLPQWQLWQERRVKIIPLRPLDNDSAYSLRAKFTLAKLRETYGQDLMAVSVWTDDRSRSCTGWRRGWILPQDLTKTISQLREQAIMAEAGNDTGLASVKRLAMFAQLPPKQHYQVTPWEEIFLAPHQTGS